MEATVQHELLRDMSAAEGDLNITLQRIGAHLFKDRLLRRPHLPLDEMIDRKIFECLDEYLEQLR